MSGSSSNNRARTGAFTVTVSGDPRFVDTVRTITRKAAEADGCAGADAARLAEAVERVMDLRFEPGGHAFSVEIRVPALAVASPGGTLERSLAAHGGLDAVRSLAPGAEFGEAGTHHFCRIACLHETGSS